MQMLKYVHRFQAFLYWPWLPLPWRSIVQPILFCAQCPDHRDKVVVGRAKLY